MNDNVTHLRSEASQSESATEATLSRLYGVVDRVKPNRVGGWVIDRADANAAATVELWREGDREMVTTADRPRPDLEKAGLGTGRYGFAFDLDPPLEPGLEFTVSVVARLPNGVSLRLSHANDESGPPVDPSRKLAERTYERVARIERIIGAGVRERVEESAASLLGTVERLETSIARIEASIATIKATPARERPQRNGALALAAFIAGAALATAWMSLS